MTGSMQEGVRWISSGGLMGTFAAGRASSGTGTDPLSLRRPVAHSCLAPHHRPEFDTTVQQIEAALGNGRWAASAALQAAMEDPRLSETPEVRDSRQGLVYSSNNCLMDVRLSPTVCRLYRSFMALQRGERVGCKDHHHHRQQRHQQQRGGILAAGK